MLILTVMQGPEKGRRFELPDDEPQLIGRSSESLPVMDQTISRRHSELTPDEGRWYIRDLESSNGTFVNGVRVEARLRLHPGDQIRAGSTLFLFGIEATKQRRRGVRVAKKGDMDVHVESVAASNEDSMILAVAEPSEAAVVQLKVIYEMTSLIGSTVDREELLRRVMDLIFEYFDADRGFVLLQDKPEQRPDPVVIRHRVPPAGNQERHISVSRTIVQHVIGHQEGVLSSNAMTDQRFEGGDSVQSYGIRSAMCVPIIAKDQIFGVIHIDSQIVNYTFTEDQLRLLTAIGVHTGLAMANAQLYAAQISKERLAVVGQTVASLSHSIRNIIQGLRGGADVVELGFRKNNVKVMRGGWDIVSRNLERIYNLTLNMLAYSKQHRPDYELTNVNALLEEAAALMQTQYDAKSVALITDLDPDMPPSPIDPSGIHQAVLNLLNNALDAVAKDDGAVSMTSHFNRGNQTIEIRVSDNGIGIKPEVKRNLFEPFQSTKGLRGTGLGLVVTKKVMDEHHGRIEVESTPDAGATFTLHLPIREDLLLAASDTHGPGGESQESTNPRAIKSPPTALD